MHRFTDTAGREWMLRVNVGTARRAKEDAGIDILGLLDAPKDGAKSQLETLSEDPSRIVPIVASLCKEQIADRKIDAFTFEEGFDGETLEKATNALLEEIIDFFPNPRRAILKKAKAMADKEQQEAAKAALEMMENQAIVGAEEDAPQKKRPGDSQES